MLSEQPKADRWFASADGATGALALPGGRYVVPANRWDLVADRTPPELPVSVIIPYYDDQRTLDRLLGALSGQTYPARLLDVVVADDGSPRAPTVPRRLPGGIRVRLVRQDDRGFRAAAARNLGVSVAAGDLLCFLDQDVVPEPTYVERLVRLPALLPDALVAGRRRHADLGNWSDDAIRRWFAGDDAAPVELPEPVWLTGAYTRTQNLLHVDDSCFRYLISAVMCCSRILFDDIDGFDESFGAYGGEDWEFAYRAVVAGAVLAHQPDAVAWHDGPDWASRGTETDRTRQKAAEDATLARLIPHPVARPHARPDDEAVDVWVRMDQDEPVVVQSLFTSGLDVAVYLPVGVRTTSAPRPRLRHGQPSQAVRARARFAVTITDARRFDVGHLRHALAQLETTTAPHLSVPEGGYRIARTAAVRRARRWSGVFADPELAGTARSAPR